MDFRSFSTLALFLSCASLVFSQCLTPNDMQPTTPKAKSVLQDGRMQFALKTLKKIAEIEKEDNVFYSPHSIHQALSLVYFGSAGSTEKSLKEVLGIPDDLTKVDVMNYFFYEKSAELKRQKMANYKLSIANKIWISSEKKIRECMIANFGAELEKANFKEDPEKERMRINEWVSTATEGNIKDLVPKEAVGSETDLILANAMFFKGLWQSKFNENMTKNEVFFMSPKNLTLTPFMMQSGSFSYSSSEKLGAHILKLPYKGEEVSMFVLLPPSVTMRSHDGSSSPNDNLLNLVHRLTSSENSFKDLEDAFESDISVRTVNVAIPKFQMERNLPLNDLLKAVGAGEVVSLNATLTEFLEKGEGTLRLGDSAHRAKIEVNEEGSTAAAATAIFSFRSSRPAEPISFKADHPFLYIIYDHVSRSILFSGIYRKPESLIAV